MAYENLLVFLFSVYIWNIISLARYVLLLVGILREKPALMLPHLVFDAFGIMLGFFLWIMITAGISVFLQLGTGILFFVVLGIYLGVYGHFLAVAFSHYKELDFSARKAKNLLPIGKL